VTVVESPAVLPESIIERKSAARDEVRDGVFESRAEVMAAEAQVDARSAAHKASLPLTAQFEADFERFLSDEPVARWMQPLRMDAMKSFKSLGFPTTKNEDWHFTSVAEIAEAEWRPLRSEADDVSEDKLEPFLFGQSWPRIVFVNGRFSRALSTIESLPEGVVVCDLDTGWREHPGVLEPRVGAIASHVERPITALNTALAADGVVVLVPRSVECRDPIHVVYVNDANAAKGVAHMRNLIVLGANSAATVIESYVSLGDATYFTNAVTEVDVADGATLRHYKIQRESRRAYHIGTIEARQARDSHYVSFSFATGATLSRTNIYALLDGAGCGATLNGLYLADGDQHVDHQTRIEHAKPDCYSREVYKGILDGSAHGVFNGKVYVRPAAQKTDGKQTNNTLLLSDRAQIDAKPQLEIFADDVKCTHGATVGRLDEVALFYLKSRGVGAEQARRLMTYAFAADVLEMIELAEIRDGLESMVLERFTGAEEMR
jgi:Fe-S cluster assembly protein SufD